MPAKCALPPKKPTRHFADGGVIGTDGLTDAQRAKINGARSSLGISDVSPSPQNPEAKQQPQAQQRPEAQGITTGIVGILKGRAAQIDKAAGYANGGKPGGGLIVGPGTPTSDSIPAEVRETGENIKVSTDERILSKAQDKFLQSVAKNAGYESLDAMLEDGTGKPVGPTIKAGKRAAEDGLSPDLDPFAFRGGKEFGAAGPVNGPSSTALGPSAGITVAPGADDRTRGAIAAVPVLAGPIARSEPLGTLTGPVNGLAIPDKPQAPGQAPSMIRTISELGVTAPGATGRDANGIITADSAKAAMGNDMQRSGGIFGTFDGKGVNEIMARENKARGEMIDSMIAANGGNGIAVLPEYSGPTSGPADGIDLSGLRLSDREKARLMTQARGQDLVHASDMARAGLTARGLDARDQTQADRLDLLRRGQDIGLQRAAERNDVIARGQDMRAETADKRTATITERRGQPTLAQERSNAEIDAARERISGMDAAEIKRKTANFTSTGRENPDFDPTLAKAVSLANRRKVGDDQHFDERQQPAANPFGFDRKEVAGRFRSEKAMDRYRLGNDTENGVEVLDASGKIVGHYR